MDVLALRLTAQGVATRDRTPLQVAATFSLQDSPPQAAATAVNARSDGAAELPALLERRELVVIPNPRTALSVLPAEDAGTFLAALQPPDEQALRTVLLRAVPEDFDAARARDLAVEAVSDALDGRSLSRDALHEELRQRLPEPLLPWCDGCKSHHARRGLLTVAALAGRLCVAGRQGRQNLFARTDQWIRLQAAEDAEAVFARRHLESFGQARPADFAAWAGIANGHARRLLEAAGEVEPVEPVAARGVRLLGPGDPLLVARDRDNLVPKEIQKRLFRPVGSPGLVLADGRPAGLWRARKQGRRLAIETEWFDGPVEIREEAERLAALRGAVYDA